VNFDPTLISSVGFPIVVASYLLVKFEKTLNENTLALIDLKKIIKERVK